jgi:hypothetical protein
VVKGKKDQIIAYRSNGHWNVLIHMADGVIRLFSDMIAPLALAVVRLFQRRGCAVAEMAGTRYLDLLLSVPA